jgi:hypothetical protein
MEPPVTARRPGNPQANPTQTRKSKVAWDRNGSSGLMNPASAIRHIFPTREVPALRHGALFKKRFQAYPRNEEATLKTPLLPAGYRLQLGADVLELRRPDGSLAAAFSTRGFTEEAVGHVAWEDYGEEEFENPLLTHMPPTLERG